MMGGPVVFEGVLIFGVEDFAGIFEFIVPHQNVPASSRLQGAFNNVSFTPTGDMREADYHMLQQVNNVPRLSLDNELFLK